MQTCVKIFILFLTFGSLWLQAKPKEHLYDIEKGIVYYDIRGFALLTPETKLEY